MDEQEQRLGAAVDHLINTIDLKYLRVLRKQGFQCSAACCDSAKTNEQLQHCVDTCSRPVALAEEAIGNELQSFQRSLSICAKQCM